MKIGGDRSAERGGGHLPRRGRVAKVRAIHKNGKEEGGETRSMKATRAKD